MKNMTNPRFVFSLLLSILVFMPSVSAANGVSVPPAYRVIASEYDIPPVLLYSVALTESGGAVAGLPWPWAVNHAGRGIYFRTRRDAYAYLSQQLEQGNRNFDVGLMQVNWRWNGHIFPSLWAALDPYTNLRGGARILQRLHRRLGSYEAAVGAYHAPGDSARAAAYRERVRERLSDVLARTGTRRF